MCCTQSITKLIAAKILGTRACTLVRRTLNVYHLSFNETWDEIYLNASGLFFSLRGLHAL